MHVFLSSRFLEFQRLRQEIRSFLEIAGHHVEAMETCPVFLADTRDKCRQHVRRSQLGLLILGAGYGSCPRDSPASYTELEFRAMLELGLPWLAFEVHSSSEIEPEQHRFIEEVRAAGTGTGRFAELAPGDAVVAHVLAAVSRAQGDVEEFAEKLTRRAEQQVKLQLDRRRPPDAPAQATSSEFATRYEQGLYISRHLVVERGARLEAHEVFWERFVGAPDKDGRNCFVVAGRTGAGKTNLICDLAHSACTQRDTLPLLLSGSALLPDRANLARAILEALTGDDKPRDDDNVLQDLVTVLLRLIQAEPRLRVIVFADAINEIPSAGPGDGLGWFNEEFSELLAALSATRATDGRLDDHVLFCLTCRTEYWSAFSEEPGGSNWMDRIHGAPQRGLPTHELGSFGPHEYQMAEERYFRVYGLLDLGVQVTGTARHMLREPVLLRYFCEAYGSRDPRTPPRARPGEVIHSLRRMEIFDKMVDKFRAQLAAEHGSGDSTSEAIFELTTRYLIHIAHLAHERDEVQGFSLTSVHEAAVSIEHPDAHIPPAQLSRATGSMFQAMLGHGLIVQREGEREAYSFVFDSYYEFSLGRYFALVEWQRMSDDEVVRWLGQRVSSDDAAPQRPRDPRTRTQRTYSDLVGAVPYAILLTETSSAFARRRGLFARLVAVLLAGNYLWVQQGLSILRDSRVASRMAWEDGDDAARMRLDRELRRTLQRLEAVATSSDHVKLQDIEATLRQFAGASLLARRTVVDALRSWALSESQDAADRTEAVKARLRRIYAAGALTRLSEDVGDAHQDDDVFHGLFGQLVSSPLVTRDFWVARSLAATAARLSTSATRQARETYYASIEQVFLANTGAMGDRFGDDVAIRGECVRVLLSLAGGDEDLGERTLRLLATEPDPWVWWRLVHGLSSSGADGSGTFVSQTLERALTVRSTSPDLDHAITSLHARVPVLELGDGTQDRPSPTYGTDPHASGEVIGGGADGVVVYHPVFLEPAYANHPECRERLAAILHAFRHATDLDLGWIEPGRLPPHLPELVHNARTDRHRGGAAWAHYLADVQDAENAVRAGREGHGQLSGPMEMRPGVLRVADYSAGAVVTAVDQVLRPDGPRAAWAINRPPGHLANNLICVLSNAACATEHAVERLRRTTAQPRVMVLDCDVHHGKHTQRVFEERDDVLYVSLHVEEDYSLEDGRLTATGTGQGIGCTCNLPFPPGTGDQGFALLAEGLVAPMLLGFQPHLIVLSCGFDGLASDPLTPQALLTPDSYGALARVLRCCADHIGEAHARRVPVVGTLEGGYSLSELGIAYLAVAREFAREPRRAPLTLGTPASDGLDRIRRRIEQRLRLQPADLSWQPASPEQVHAVLADLAS